MFPSLTATHGGSRNEEGYEGEGTSGCHIEGGSGGEGSREGAGEGGYRRATAGTTPDGGVRETRHRGT